MLTAIFVFIILTQLDGTPVWVDHATIQIFKRTDPGKHPTCPHNAGAAVTVGPRAMCIKETPKQICDKVEKYGGKCERQP